MADLSEYNYFEEYVRPGLLAVGWLDEHHAVPKGACPPMFLERLWGFCQRRIAQTRGHHFCPLCLPRRWGPVRVQAGNERVLLGDAELRVFSTSGLVFAAPNLIHHYVEAHGYLPPQSFVDAILTGPLPGSAEYEERVKYCSLEDDLR